MKIIHFTVVLVALSCFALAGVSVAAQAKTPKSTPNTPNTTVANNTGQYRLNLLKQVDLTKEEKAEIKQIRTAAREQLEQKILAVLTPAQKEQLQQLPPSTGTTPGKHKHGST